MENGENQNDDFERAKFSVYDTPSFAPKSPAIRIPVMLENTEMEMELVTGAAVSVVSHADYCKIVKHLPLTVAKCKLHAYTRTPLKVMGEVMFKVYCNTQECRLLMVVIKSDTHAPLHFGRF